MIFIDFQTEVKRRLIRDASSSDITEFLKRWINIAQRTVAGETSWKDLRRTWTITTVDGQEEYPLDYMFGSVAFVWHRTFGYNYKVTPVPERLFVQMGMDGITEGPVYWYRIYGGKNVLAQPSAASVITVVSSTSDTAKIHIEGIVSGYPDREEITLSGTTPVLTTKQFTEVHRISKSEATTGRITLTSNSAAVTVGVLPAGLASQTLRRKFIKFYYIPDTDGDSIYVYGHEKILNMVDDNDVPQLPEEFDEAITLKACHIGMAYEEGLATKAEYIDQKYDKEIRRLRKLNTKDDDWTPILNSFGKAPSMRGLNFGAYYPRMTR
jgi:hypothetical protein